jgi:hypothetical protein
MNGEAATEAVGTCRFPVYGVSAYTPMCPEGTEGVFVQRRYAPRDESSAKRTSSL